MPLLLIAFAQPIFAQSAPACLELPAWTSLSSPTRIPANGTCDVSSYEYLAGYLGLRSFYGGGGDWSQSVAELFWTRDAAGEQVVTEQPITLHAGIQSLGQFSLPSLAPYVYVIIQPVNGLNATAMSMRGSHTLSPWPTVLGDTLLITQTGICNGDGGTTFYPADYWAGPTQIYFAGGSAIELFSYDLTYQKYVVDKHGPGTFTTVTPMGTWGVYLTCAPGANYAVTATPMLSGGIVRTAR